MGKELGSGAPGQWAGTSQAVTSEHPRAPLCSDGHRPYVLCLFSIKANFCSFYIQELTSYGIVRVGTGRCRNWDQEQLCVFAGGVNTFLVYFHGLLQELGQNEA